MSSVSLGLLICSRLLSGDEVAHYLRLASTWAQQADSTAAFLPSDAGALDRDVQRHLRDEAARHREFRSSVIPGDKVWHTAGAPSHSEVDHGEPYLVVIRGTNVITRYRPGGLFDAEWGLPILDPEKQLTRDEVIAIASDWVRARYPTVPEVIRVQEFSDQTLNRLERARGNRYSPIERRQLSDHWWVYFATPCDTDETGIPPRLRVVVDDITGRADLAR
jgi:hypothetical protein